MAHQHDYHPLSLSLYPDEPEFVKGFWPKPRGWQAPDINDPVLWVCRAKTSRGKRCGDTITHVELYRSRGSSKSMVRASGWVCNESFGKGCDCDPPITPKDYFERSV